MGSKIFVRNVDTSRKHADSKKNADTGTEGYGQEVVWTGGGSMLKNMRP